ncbi:MAG: ABC transporter substrate-binding protein, partial [Candidatus Contendobacter sp.]|nr:ABC transporter substrate-binding protein [Candidatus Contendobacter sp.]
MLILLISALPFRDVIAAEKVSIQLRWDHQFQFAGYYAAQWQGYYADAGFEVEIRSALTPDGTILSATQEVAQGHADFGVGAADILMARDQGIPLVVLASIFQQSAAEFYAKEGTPLQSPVDLLKLRVARIKNDLIDVELQAMLYS